MPSHMKNLALVAAVAGRAIAGDSGDAPTTANPWEAWPTTTQGPDCKPWYEPYVCDDDNGGEYTTTYTLYSKGCPGYTSWADWPPVKTHEPADPWNTWSADPKPKPTWNTWSADPKPTWNTWESDPKPTWTTWDPKPTAPWGSWDPKPTNAWGGWDGKPKAPVWPGYLGPKPSGWDDWKYVPVAPAPPAGWYEWNGPDGKPADWDDWKYQPSQPAPPPGWFEWDDSKGPAPQGWDDWKYIIVVPVWPADKGDKPQGWDQWVYVPSKPAPPAGWFEWDGSDSDKPANWDDWKYVPHPVWPDSKGDKPQGWDKWVYVEDKPAPPPQWFEWDGAASDKPAYWDDWKSAKPITTAWENYGAVVTITFVETYKVPCSTGWEYDTTTVYATHCGCTETPVPEHPAYTTIVKSDCPESWGLGATVTYSTPVAEATTWNTWGKPADATTWSTWAKPADTTTYPDGGKSWGVWSTSATPVKATQSAQWSNIAQWQGAASTNGVSKIMVAAAGVVAGLALFL